MEVGRVGDELEGGNHCAPSRWSAVGILDCSAKDFLGRKRLESPGASRWSAINRGVDPAKQGLT
jgi:hypothetical protein